MIFKNSFYFLFIFGSIWLSVDSSPKKYIISSSEEEVKKSSDDFLVCVLIYSNDEYFENNLEISSLNENNTIDLKVDVNFFENHIQKVIIRITIGNINFNKNMKYKQIYSKEFKPDEILLKIMSIFNGLNNYRNGEIKEHTKNRIFDILNFNVNPGRNKLNKAENLKRISMQLKSLFDLLNAEKNLFKNASESVFHNSLSNLTTKLNGLLQSTISYNSYQNSTSTTELNKNSTQTSLSTTISNISKDSSNVTNFTSSVIKETTTQHTHQNSSYSTPTKDLSINLTNWLDEQLKTENELLQKIPVSTHTSTNSPTTTVHYFFPKVTINTLVNEDEVDDSAFFKKRGNLILMHMSNK